jgi:hypothetical protein
MGPTTWSESVSGAGSAPIEKIALDQTFWRRLTGGPGVWAGGEAQRRPRSTVAGKLPAVRRAGSWAWIGVWAATLACSGAPSPTQIQRDAEPATVEPVDTVANTRADDPVLARARGQMRRGRVPDAVREQLLASRDPNHRHAARLLQAVAGETPAAVLSRADGEAAPSPDPAPDPSSIVLPNLPEPASIEPAEPAEPKPAEPVALVEEDRSGDARLDPPPKWDDVPPESPLRAWLAGSVNEVEPELPPAAIDLAIERLLEPELSLLLRERPPRIPSGDGLVILTSMSLWPGPNEGEVSLELAGSGPANVIVAPLDQSRVRLTIPDAGAVPSFLAARPEAMGFTILDVTRREHDVELELALAPGWRLVTLAPLDNGATVGFSRSDTLSP